MEKKHIEYIIPKLSSACLVMKTVTSLMKIDTLKLVYFAYFHSMMSCGTIFWENSTDSERIFAIQKEIINIMASVKKSVVENYLKNSAYFSLPANFYSHY
jgi:hypothetical protein